MVDPIQSVKGKVVIDAFRLISPQTVLAGQEPRQTTSNIGQINKPSIQALIHGLNRHYYSIVVNYRKTDLEQAMLMNLHKRNWTEGLTLRDFKGHKEGNEKAIKVCLPSLLSFGVGLHLVGLEDLISSGISRSHYDEHQLIFPTPHTLCFLAPLNMFIDRVTNTPILFPSLVDAHAVGGIQ